MSRTSLAKELKDWIDAGEGRLALMLKEAPIGESTLRLTLSGRYNPGERLEKAIRGVMAAHPAHPEKKVAAV